MKTYFMLSLIITLGITEHAFGQQETPDPCLHRLEVANTYLTAYENPDKTLLSEIKNSITNCMDTNNADALYIKGMLLLQENPTEEQKQEAFALIEQAAAQNHANAMGQLGDLYKGGIGTSLDFDKALEWYQKAADLGNQKAAFKIGYIYLKGLGTADQDYDKAIRWFAASTYPMAKHWLAISTHHGYGTQKNTDLAIQILTDNDILNSKYLAEELAITQQEATQHQTTDTHTNPANTSDVANQVTVETANPTVASFDITALADTYTGRWVMYDWSGQHIIKSIPITIELDYDSYEDELTYTLSINGNEKKGTAMRLDDAAYFEDLSLSMDRIYKDNPDQSALIYDIQSIRFSKNNLVGVDYLVGEVMTYVPAWQEPGAPIQIILQQTSSEWDVSNEALAAFATQSEFIKLYPNPFETELLVQYELDQPAQVHASIVSLHNPSQQRVIDAGTSKAHGKQLYRIDGSDLPRGMYVIQIQVDDQTHTKLVVKQ